MQGFIAVLLLVAAVAAENQCPAEQQQNWNIEMLLRHEDCDKFYKCTFGEPIEQSCPSGLQFNLKNWQCDWPYNVDCSGRNDPLNPVPTPEPTTTAAPSIKPNTTAQPVTTTEATTTAASETNTTTTAAPITAEPTTAAPESEENGSEDSEFLENGCPVDPHVHWLLPNEEDCNKFYYCVWGELVPRECPSTLHFNRVIQVCDWPADAGCVVSANKHSGARAQFFPK
ncbi:peritrophin-1-like [Pectinophora gossypiella]|nr:peritrophin-1-like [Pectinophora gossypiella]